MFQIETISAKMLDYYVERSDAVIIDLRDPAAYRRECRSWRRRAPPSERCVARC